MHARRLHVLRHLCVSGEYYVLNEPIKVLKYHNRRRAWQLQCLKNDIASSVDIGYTRTPYHRT